jgi:hypothetical protein
MKLKKKTRKKKFLVKKIKQKKYFFRKFLTKFEVVKKNFTLLFAFR